MSDKPISEAVKDIAVNGIIIEGSASGQQGPEIHGTLEREKGGKAGGVTGGFSQTTGWTVGGFFKWMWK